MRIGLLTSGGVDPRGRRVIPELLDLIGALARRHEVHVVALKQEPEVGAWRVAGAVVWNVGPRPRRLRALLHLGQEHRRAPFDILVGYALVPQGVVAAVAGVLLGIPAVVAAPGGEFVAMPDIEFGGWRSARGRLWVRLACRAASAVVAPSSAAVATAATRGAAPRKIPLPLAADAWPLRAPRTHAPPLRLAWIGSLNRVKNPELLVDTVAYLRDQGARFAVDVMGEDFRDGSVRRRVEAAGLEPWVTFHGHLDQARVRAVLEGASLLLVTSRFEGASRVVLEAASLGIPTAGTRVGYVDDWSPDAAVAVDDATPQSLGDTVLTLLSNPQRRRELGRSAQSRLGEHDADRVAARWSALFEELVAGDAHG